MFKDYYLILGIGKDATPEEIEKAFKDTDAKFNGKRTVKNIYMANMTTFLLTDLFLTLPISLNPYLSSL